jgi:type IV pilus assembly protein PilO
MATQTKTPSFDFAAWFEQVASQFRGLDYKQPGQWALLPKVTSWLLLGAMMVGLLWVLLLSDKTAELEAERNKEPGLKQDYRGKLAQAVNLPELRKQKQQVEEYVTQLEKQLPGKAEMDALLTDINQAGIGRGLQFELFRPGAVAVRDYYAELPITIRVSGRYHDIGAFAADVANLSRIVTLHDLAITGVQREGGGSLSMDAVARTYRYLDSSEVAAQKKPAAGAKK